MIVRVLDIAHVLTNDVDLSKDVDAAVIDSFVYTAITLSQDALKGSPPPGFSEFERDQLVHIVGGLRHSHKAIRRLLSGERDASAVGALAIARLQLETLYSFCFLLQDAENVRTLLKNGWKKKYVRFLLEREEHKNLPRFSEFYNMTGKDQLDGLQRMSSVTEDERRTIEQEQLGASVGPPFKTTRIPRFPTPMGVIEATRDPNQQRLLKRLYPTTYFSVRLRTAIRSPCCFNRCQTLYRPSERNSALERLRISIRDRSLSPP